MEKGILYLVCTAVLLGLGFLGLRGIDREIIKECTIHTVYLKPVTTPTVVPTATPSATLKSSVRISTPAAATKATGVVK